MWLQIEPVHSVEPIQQRGLPARWEEVAAYVSPLLVEVDSLFCSPFVSGAFFWPPLEGGLVDCEEPLRESVT